MSDTKYFAVVTDLGTKEMMEAINEERKVNILHFAVGDGGGQYYTPDVQMTELKNEVWRGDIGSCRISEESENVMIAETIIPADVGGFTIREMAVFDDKNTMIAICNTPDTAKVRVTDGVVHELMVQMEILLNNKDSVELVTDPNIVTATKKDVELLGKDVELLRNLAEELSDIINGVVAQSGQNKTALEVLNGEAEGSIKKAIDAAFDDFATKVSDDNVVNTYKELIDYAAANGAEFTTLVGQVTDLAAKMTLGADGNEEEYATVKEYVEAYVNEQVANIEFATEDEVKSIIDGIFADSGSVDGE